MVKIKATLIKKLELRITFSFLYDIFQILSKYNSKLMLSVNAMHLKTN